MLHQARVERGMRVLEIGAGAGYNAALVAELAGPTGHVVTVDIDPVVVESPRQYGTGQLSRTELLEVRAAPVRRIDSCVEDLLRHRRERILRSEPEVQPITRPEQLCRQRALVEAIFSELTVRARDAGPRARVRMLRRT